MFNNDNSIRKRIEEAAYKMESPQDNNYVGYSSHLTSKTGDNKSHFQSQHKTSIAEGLTQDSGIVPQHKIKSQFNTEERKRKFTTHTKFAGQISKIQSQLAQHNLEHLRASSQVKSGVAAGFACIPNVISYASPNLAPTNLT